MKYALPFFICLFYLTAIAAQPQQVIQKGHLLIHIPDAAKSKPYPLLICFGGSAWATPKFLLNHTPKSYFDKAIIVYSPCYIKGGRGLKRIELEIRALLQQEKISIRHTSICGFSSGGPDVLIAEQPNRYKAIGLIDCSPVANGHVQYYANMIFSFRRNNWIYSDYYGAVVNFKPFDELILAIQAAGGYTEESDIQHKAYFSYFLNKFQDALIGE